jgi:peptidoglycan/LPS O-acetylase OafA/YrhL
MGPVGVKALASPASPPGRLDALTGLRFIAAVVVVLYHVARPALAGSPEWLRQIIAAGHVGVSLFFVHSGFVLAYRYLDADGARPLDRVAFWCARLARLWPLYLTGLLITLPFPDYPAGLPDWLSLDTAWGLVVVSTLTFTQAWLPDLQMVWNGPGWSLSVEAFFYALFPLLCVPFARWRSPSLLALCGACWAAALALPMLYIAMHPDGSGAVTSYALWSGPEQAMAYGQERSYWAQYVIFTPLVRLPEFLLGAAAGVLYLRDRKRGRRRPGALLAGIGALGVVGGMWAGAWIPYLLLNNGLLAPCCVLLMYGLAHGGGPLAWLLSRRPMLVLGEASYGVYILQTPVLIWLGLVFGLLAPVVLRVATGAPAGATAAAALLQSPAGRTASVAVYVVVLVGAAVGAYYVLERPWRASLRRFLLGVFGRGRGRDRGVGKVIRPISDSPLPP